MAKASKVIDFGVVAKVKTAVKPSNRLATAIGAILGGFVPVATFTVAHSEVTQSPMMWMLVAAGLLYSAMTVFQWSKEALKNQWKAGGFCLLLEGTMTFSHTTWLAMLALSILVGINAIAAGANLTVRGRK